MKTETSRILTDKMKRMSSAHERVKKILTYKSFFAISKKIPT